MSYQLQEISKVMSTLHCPYCRRVVISHDIIHAEQLCEHILFIAMDLGFEYISDRFEASMPQSVNHIHADDNMNIWQVITSTSFAPFILIKMPLGVANMYRYLGFFKE